MKNIDQVGNKKVQTIKR